MGADRDASRRGGAHGSAQHRRVASVKACGDARGGDVRDQGVIVANDVVSEGFAEIGVEIDAHGCWGALANVESKGREGECTKQEGTA